MNRNFSRRRITREPVPTTPEEVAAFSALKILRSEGFEGGQCFKPDHFDAGIRFVGVPGFLGWHKSGKWCLVEVSNGLGLTRFLGGMIQTVNTLNSINQRRT